MRSYFLTVVLVFLSGVKGFGEDLEDLVPQVSDGHSCGSVVRIYSNRKDGGSYYLGAGHVIEDSWRPFRFNGVHDNQKIHIVKESARYDLFLAYVPGITGSYWKIAEEFESGEVKLLGRKGYTKPTLKVITGEFIPEISQYINGYMTCSPFQGMSGGPVMHKGRVVGSINANQVLLLSDRDEPDLYGVMVRLYPIHEFLRYTPLQGCWLDEFKYDVEEAKEWLELHGYSTSSKSSSTSSLSLLP